MSSVRLYQIQDFEVTYFYDGIAVNKNVAFLEDEEFRRAYLRGVAAVGQDWGIHWRAHTILWAAKNALALDGDFVECGVGRGFMSSMIMNALDWNSTGRNFYLFDTFSGVLGELCTEAEKAQMDAAWGGVEAHNQAHAPYYAQGYESVAANFSEWRNATLIKGSVPDTLGDVAINKVAYLHIDMNCVEPEIAAIRHFWPKLTMGACVVLDDYAFPGYELQYSAWNDWSREQGAPILTLPTGQGLILKN